MRQYVVYVHASSGDQYRAGQEIEAQEREIDRFLEHSAPRPWRVIGFFTETSAGTDKGRPQLEAARALVRRTPGAELLVAPCDRRSEARTSSPDPIEALAAKRCGAEASELHAGRLQAHSAQVLAFARPGPSQLRARA